MFHWMKLSFTAVLFTLSGCASINSVSLTPIPQDRSRVVKAQTSKTIFLGFNFNNHFVETLSEDLRRQCPKGVVSGILTKDETISYFLVFTRKVSAHGFCSGSTGEISRAEVSPSEATR